MFLDGESISSGPHRCLGSPTMILGIESSAVSTGRLVRTSDFHDRHFGLAAGSCEQSTGVRSRSVCTDESVPQFAARALRAALDAASLRVRDLDLLVFAGASRHQPIPSSAAMVLHEMAETGAAPAAFDVDATCLSFLQAFDLATALLESGRHRRIAIVSAETPTRFLDPECPRTYPLIGDGAVAFILNAAAVGIPFVQLASGFRNHAEHARHCQVRGGLAGLPAFDLTPENRRDYLFQMDGKSLYRAAAVHLPPFLAEFEKKAGLAVPDFDLVVPHQASRSALDLLARRLRIRKEGLVDILADHGNQVAASIPTALHHALHERRPEPGSTLLMIGTGAGLGLGALGLKFAAP